MKNLTRMYVVSWCQGGWDSLEKGDLIREWEGLLESGGIREKERGEL
jgi:hypothetical protein